MNYNIYAIQDVMIGFNAPVLFKNDEIAKREFGNFLENNPNKSDMRLFRIGKYNDETGEIESEIPSCIMGGNQ